MPVYGSTVGDHPVREKSDQEIQLLPTVFLIANWQIVRAAH